MRPRRARRSPSHGNRISNPSTIWWCRAAAAMRLIDVMTRPENQAKLANLIAYAPTNPAAFSAVDPQIAPWLSTQPENIKRGFVINAEYWRDNLKRLQERWAAWKLA